MKSEFRELGVFLGAALATLAPALLLSEIIDLLGGPDSDSRIVRLVMICLSILVGVVFSYAYRDVTLMSAEELAEISHQARTRARWWEVSLAGLIIGSWAYVLLNIGGRIFERLDLVSFSISTPVVALFAVASLAAAIVGAIWWSFRPGESN